MGLSYACYGNGVKFDVSTIADMSNKVTVVTGGNTGLGYETTLAFLNASAKVYILCRDPVRAEEAIVKLRTQTDKGEVIFVPFDLTDAKSAQNAAKTIMEKEKRLDIVVANAGVMSMPYKIINGAEVQFWNHLGHYALIEPLLPLLIATSKTSESSVRIVNVSSLAHTMISKPDYSSIEVVNGELGSTWTRYGQSKLANILYTNSLVKRLEGENIACLSLHPGIVSTSLVKTGTAVNYPGLLGKVAVKVSGLTGMKPLEGAKTQIWAATSPEIDSKKLNGSYLIPIATVAACNVNGKSEIFTQQLEELSKKFIAEYPVAHL